MKKANLNAVPLQTAEFAAADEIIRLKALGNSLEALAIRASEGKAPLDSCQVEEIGRMVVELAESIQEKLGEL